MRGALLVALLSLVACGGEPPCDPDARGRFEGAWSGFESGREDREWTLLVTGECVFLSGPGGSSWLRGQGTFAPAGDEGPMDLRIDECDCPAVGHTALARFRMRGEELQIVGFAPGSGQRPTSFAEEGAQVLRLWRSQP